MARTVEPLDLLRPVERDGQPLRPQPGGNVVLDARLGRIPDPEGLAERLDRQTGVVEHGLFLGIASLAILATRDGIVVLEGPSALGKAE